MSVNCTYDIYTPPAGCWIQAFPSHQKQDLTAYLWCRDLLIWFEMMLVFMFPAYKEDVNWSLNVSRPDPIVLNDLYIWKLSLVDKWPILSVPEYIIISYIYNIIIKFYYSEDGFSNSQQCRISLGLQVNFSLLPLKDLFYSSTQRASFLTDGACLRQHIMCTGYFLGRGRDAGERRDEWLLEHLVLFQKVVSLRNCTFGWWLFSQGRWRER